MATIDTTKINVTTLGNEVIKGIKAAGTNWDKAPAVLGQKIVDGIVTSQLPAPPTQPTDTPPPIQDGTAHKFVFDLSQCYELNTPVGTAWAQLFDGNTKKQIDPGYGKAIAPTTKTPNNYWVNLLKTTLSGLTITKVVAYGFQGSSTEPWVLNAWAKGKTTKLVSYTGVYQNSITYPINNVLAERLNIVTSNSIWPSQLEVWGTWIPKAIVRQQRKPIPFNSGVNGFEWDWEKGNNPDVTDPGLTNAMKPFNWFRHYLDWAKIQPTEGNWYWDSTPSGGWNYDALYTTAKANGIDPLVCLQSIPQWLFNKFYPGETPYEGEKTPCALSADKSDPKSYLLLAQLCFQVSARYGRTKVADNLLKANTDPVGNWSGARLRTKKTAMDLVNVIEPGNELSKWWRGLESYQNGYQMGAMLSATFDGHKGTMGVDVGMKTADPTMKMAIPGAPSPDTDWFLGIIDWSESNRGYKSDGTIDLPFDYINFHYYSGSTQSGGVLACPEMSGVDKILHPLVDLALQYGVEIFWSETGNDIQPGSPIACPVIGSKSALQVEADWILRTALLAVRNGVNRTYIYNAYDLFPGNPVQYGTSGICGKPAATALATAKSTLSGLTFNSALSKVDGDVYIDCYSGNGKNVYVVFYGSQSGKTGNYTLNGKSVAISETPVYVQG